MFGADAPTQSFLDDTIEDNVARCSHARPQPRPDPRAVPAPKPKPKAKPKSKDVATKAPPAWRWPPVPGS